MPKKETYIKMFEQIACYLKNKQSFKHPLISFVQKNKLNNTELYILIRALSKKVLDIHINADATLKTIYSDAKDIISNKDLATIFIDNKSALLDSQMFLLYKGDITLLKNPLGTKIKAVAKKTKTINPVNIIKQLDKYAIGQTEAKEKLTIGVCEHLLKCHLSKTKNINFTKNNILISGPSGCGKTFLCKTLAQIIGIPFVHADATKYSKTGYSGMDINSCIIELASQTKVTNGKIVPSIIFIDEADKLKDDNSMEVGTVGVQEELLRLLEATTVSIESKNHARMTFGFDISNILFIVGGAFNGLDEIVAKRHKRSIGFMLETETDDNMKPTAEDFIEYGLMPKLVGRFGNFITLNSLTENELRDILTNPYNGPIMQYKRLFKVCGADIVFNQKDVDKLITENISKDVGARCLNSKVSEYFQKEFLKISFKVEI